MLLKAILLGYFTELTKVHKNRVEGTAERFKMPEGDRKSVKDYLKGSARFVELLLK